MPTAQQIIDIALRDVGYIETPNNRTKFGRWYGMDGVPWCDIWVSWVFNEAGALHLAHGKNAYTPAHAEKFRRAGQWGTTPRLGAVVFFKFPGGPNRIHHVGLVVAGGGPPIETVEGNTSRGSAGSQRDGGGVWRRRRATGIVGYGYPAYDASGPPPPPPPPSGVPPFPGTLRRGMKGENVRKAQERLNLHSPQERRITVDGDFGANTELRTRQFQAAKGLQQVGYIGPKTWEALWR